MDDVIQLLQADSKDSPDQFKVCVLLCPR